MVSHIYHLADLHFRNLRRHGEYRAVLNGFLQAVDRDNIGTSVIYIGGDIAHAKTDMSPELVREISWFLSECARRRDTFIIAGNHDTNLSNSDRLDVISPIVENLNNPKIHYLKASGVTYYENIAFSTFSVLDDPNSWVLSADIDPNFVKICLFHGAVDSSKTDVGYVIKSDKYKIGMFDGFDYALLGDIHKRQVLQTRSVKDGVLKPYVAYPSSTIQQDHGENISGHGYILWNIIDHSYQEFDLHNDYAYATFDIENDVVPDIYSVLGNRTPSKLRCRIRYGNSSYNTVTNFIVDLKSKFSVVDLAITKTQTSQSIGVSSNKDILNVMDSSVRAKVVEDYFIKKGYSNRLSQLKEIHNTVEHNIGYDVTAIGGNVWKPVKFTFSNMFSYGEDNVVDFTKLYGIVGLFAPNAHGKSSLIEALVYCIFGKSTKSNSVKSILNIRKDYFECTLHFKINDVDYYIERKTKQSKSGNAKNDLSFWKMEDGVKVSLNGVTTKDTNNKIQDYVGTYDDFMLTAMSSQTNNSLFVDKGQADRKDILSKFMGLDVFESLHGDANVAYKDAAFFVKHLESKIAGFDLDSVTAELSNLEQQRKTLETKIEADNQRINAINNEISALTAKKVSVPTDYTDVTKLEADLSVVRANVEKFSNAHNTLNQDLTKYKELDQKLNVAVEAFEPYDIIEQKCDQYKKLERELDSANNALKSKTELLKRLKTEFGTLEQYRYNSNCDVCIENNKATIARTGTLATSIADAETEIDTINIRVGEINSELLVLAPYLDVKTKYDDILNKAAVVQNKIRDVVIQIKDLELKTERAKTEIDRISSSIVKANDYIDANDQNLRIDAAITELKGKLNQIGNVKWAGMELTNIVKRIGSLDEQIRTHDEYIEKLSNAKDTANDYLKYIDAVNRNGIPYQIIKEAIPVIEDEVNAILAQVVGFCVKFEMDDKNINTYISYNDTDWDLDLASGMERFISGVAIRLALMNVCNLSKPDFLIIDEGFGVLDSENLSSVYRLFEYLKSQFNFVLVISHIDSMRDVVDQLIDINKKGENSSVVF